MRSREWRIFLEDMLAGCKDVQSFTRNKTIEDLIGDKALNYAVLHALQIIGEAANNIPDEIQTQMPDIDWRGVIGVRHVIVHGYTAINYTTVWDIVQHRVPEHEITLETLLNAT